jgi:hypothetical protein
LNAKTSKRVSIADLLFAQVSIDRMSSVNPSALNGRRNHYGFDTADGSLHQEGGRIGTGHLCRDEADDRDEAKIMPVFVATLTVASVCVMQDSQNSLSRSAFGVANASGSLLL